MKQNMLFFQRHILLYITLSITLSLIGFTCHAQNNKKKEERQPILKVINLPRPYYQGTVSLEQVIKQRRSLRNYSDQSLSLEEVSQLLWAAQGITDEKSGKRSAPSAGAKYPLEIYILVGNVKELEEGIYHYNPNNHTIENIYSEDVRDKLMQLCFNQNWVKTAPLVMIITAIYERVTEKYTERGKRYVHFEVGHVAQNVALQAEALKMGLVPVGAFNDEGISKLLKLPKNEVPMYVLPIGKKIK